MMVGVLVVFAMGMTGLLLAEEEAARSKTERLDFPSGGVLHLQHSIGEVTIEGWDRPEMEMTTTKSPVPESAGRNRELDEIQVSAQRHGEEILVMTTLPHRRSFPPPAPWKGLVGINVDYHIQVPRDAGLVIEHQGGEVHLAELTGDIRVTSARGEISLRVPAEAQYAIDAKTDLGSVVSDFPGTVRRRVWLLGHRFVPEEKTGGHKLYLRNGAGDIIILRIRKPPTPPPVGHS